MIDSKCGAFGHRMFRNTCLDCGHSDPAKFKLGQALDVYGDLVPAWGLEHNGQFIVNPCASPCLRFHVSPADYGLSDADASMLVSLNTNRDLLAYWDL